MVNFRRPLVTVTLIMLVAACGSGGAGTTQTTTDAGTAPTAAGPATTAGPAASSELTVLEWAFYEVPEMWVEFGEAHPETEVIFNFGASDGDIYAKILAGSGEDIMHFYTPYLQSSSTRRWSNRSTPAV